MRSTPVGRELLEPRPSTTDFNMLHLNQSTTSLPAMAAASNKPRKLTPLIKPTLEDSRIR